VQHDCRTAGCSATALKAQVQERQATEKMDKLIAHSDDNHFLVNLYALHNANLLRSVLPRELYAPGTLYQDRKAHHFEAAAKLRTSQGEKRAEAKKRRQAKAEEKRAKAAEAARNGESSSDSEVMADDELNGSEDDGEEQDVRRPAKRKRAAR